MNESTRCGLVAVVGRPNVGKSTLVNALVGEKVSIVTAKPQTTRHRLLGILTTEQAQIGFVDTPGLHRGGSNALNRNLNRAAAASLAGVDLVLLVVEAGRWTGGDELALEKARGSACPVLLVMNKIDRLDNRNKLLPEMEQAKDRHDFVGILPTSALRSENLDALLDELRKRLPQGPFLYPDGQGSTAGQAFIAAETVREKLFNRLHQELPYSLTVQTERIERDDSDCLHIAVVVWVAKDSQKGIVIGKGGAVLKAVGSAARKELQQRWGRGVRLDIWVKVRDNWVDDEAALRSLGLTEDGY